MSLVSSSCPRLFSQPPHRMPTLAGTRLLIHSPLHSFIYSRVSHSSLFLTDTHSQVCPLAEAFSEDNQGTCGSKDPPLNACHPISSPVCSHHYYCSLAHFFSHPAPVTCSFQILFQFQSTEKLFTSPPPFHKLRITARTRSLGRINDRSLTKKKFFKNYQMVQRCRCRLKWPFQNQRKSNGPPVSDHICFSVMLDVRLCSIYFGSLQRLNEVSFSFPPDCHLCHSSQSSMLHNDGPQLPSMKVWPWMSTILSVGVDPS